MFCAERYGNDGRHKDAYQAQEKRRSHVPLLANMFLTCDVCIQMHIVVGAVRCSADDEKLCVVCLVRVAILDLTRKTNSLVFLFIFSKLCSEQISLYFYTLRQP